MVICCIIGCKSRSEQKLQDITFHTFPKDSAIRKLWIHATGRQNWQPTKNARICSRHFEQRCFRKTARNMTYLKPFSIPTLHIVEQASYFYCINVPMEILPTFIEPIAIPSSSHHIPMQIESTSTQVENSESMKIEMTPRKKKLVNQLNRKSLLAETRKKKLAILRSKNLRLLKRNAELSAIIATLKEKRFINQEAADLLSSVNPGEKLKFQRSKFSPEVRKFALNLHFISPRAYNFVRNTFNTCLPHTRTLARWYRTIEGEPGFSSEALAALKLLCTNSTQKWICGLSFDEMAIRQKVEWNGKNYVGFVNCGDQPETDVLPVAKEVLVFMLTCLNGSWKLPVGYFLVNRTTAEQKANLLKTCIDLVSECGLVVSSVTFDGCPANFSMAKLLGCQVDGDIINPVFLNNNRKIVIFPDPCHMLKLVRNTLGDKLFLTNSEGDTISWNYVKLLVELQENEGFHLANKVKSAHLHFKKQIMKVKLAAQLFSESVADALQFCKDILKLEQYSNCEPTIDFIKRFNALFDIMNSRNLDAFGFKKPLNSGNIENVQLFLENMFQYINGLKMDMSNILQTNRKTGFLGFQICIKSILFLYEEYIITKKLNFLSTYKLSQDHLEIFFGAIRAKGGFNNNPTASQFQAAYKRMLVHGQLKHLSTGNCIPLMELNILTCTNPEIAINNTTDHNRLIEDHEDIQPSLTSDLVVPNDHDYLADPTRLTEFSQKVIIYIAGFVIKSLEGQIKCEQCISSLHTNEKMKDTLQYIKDKGGLRYPSKSVIKICEIAEGVFKKNKITNKKNPLHYLVQECLKKCIGLKLFNDEHDYSDRSIFENHYSLLIKSITKKYLNVRIHYATKSFTKKIDNIRNIYTKLIIFKGQ
ncbi:unnamed protein product [Euphydryas editha]|uniref:THAP-type domain-containing protein n=1 Tax=Euphydryas editha TaxID=104508 RepID=A0AAU9USL9_EUPED|nr:unnamed protein product [Euphydryas editha]